ncbi:hypothetical protein CMO89_04355 [Candidatus Woesearchaeota archaeon]|nr:hypothetical protein [Candidatus Woesearchaeota archaeon]|tara:strand:- start:14504 stop:15367 length:864 start_codon:yes stop_codon:yes gene_type:complete
MTEPISVLKEKCRIRGWEEQKHPLYQKYFIRKISIYITKLFLYTSITANQVTVFHILITLLGAVLLFFGTLEYMLIGILLMNFGFILDTVDGEIARYRKQTSILGVHIDEISHQFLPKFMYFGIAFSVFLNTAKISALIFGFLAVVFSASVVFMALTWTIVNKRLEAIKSMEDSKEGINIRQNTKKENKLSKIGEATGKFGFLYKISEKMNFLWVCPYDKLIILLLIILEYINKSVMLVPRWSFLYWFLVVYGSFFTLNQLASFIIHAKSNTAQKYYERLFGRDHNV